MHYFKTVLVYCCSYILKIAHILFKIFGHIIHSAYRWCWAHGYVCRLLAVTLGSLGAIHTHRLGIINSRNLGEYCNRYLVFASSLSPSNSKSLGSRCSHRIRGYEVLWHLSKGRWDSRMVMRKLLDCGPSSVSPKRWSKARLPLELIPIRWKWP